MQDIAQEVHMACSHVAQGLSSTQICVLLPDDETDKPPVSDQGSSSSAAGAFVVHCEPKNLLLALQQAHEVAVTQYAFVGFHHSNERSSTFHASFLSTLSAALPEASFSLYSLLAADNSEGNAGGTCTLTHVTTCIRIFTNDK